MNDNNSFFSMDRLIEFGMGMAMSQQIAQSMNNMMASMRVPPQVQVASQPLYAQNTIQQGSPMQPVYQQYAGAQQRQGWLVAPQQVSQNQAAFSQAGSQNQSNVPSAPPPVPSETLLLEQKFPEVYYISKKSGKADGPFTKTEAVRFLIENKLTAATPVWKAGGQSWQTAADFSELVALVALVPPEVPAKTGNENATKGEETK